MVGKLAEDQRMHAVLVADAKAAPPLLKTDWMLVAANAHALHRPAIAEVSVQPPVIEGLETWTDDRNNLFRILK